MKWIAVSVKAVKIAEELCPPDVDRKVWKEGFYTCYNHIKSRQERWKPLSVYQDGLFVSNARSLQEASQITGLSPSRICVLLKTKMKSRKSFSFK